MKWWKRPLCQGDANAMAKVAGLYNLGLGTEKDTQKGVLWSWLGARNGDAGAQYLLATLILEGIAGIDERSIGLTLGLKYQLPPVTLTQKKRLKGFGESLI